MEAGCPAAEGAERDARMWALPPVVPFGLLMQRLEAWLRRQLRDPQSVNREEVRPETGWGREGKGETGRGRNARGEGNG